ncbi:MAG: MFS transporter [Balneolaceae bacterium]|nr:MFS transporter [Balneolaceae bacterium]
MSKYEKLGFEPKKSVGWYNPIQLAKTGIKTIISSIFGNFNDKREIQAALYQNSDKQHFYDYRDHDEVWIDYISDLGDGFDATYTMASLVAKPELELEGEKTKRGNILIMGGDQVYPTASREEYKNRLKGPYELALPRQEEGQDRPQLFAIPGNHDWYDGLTNFLKTFGQKRKIGNWQTQQQRSYFAIQLPHNVWIFGIDVQLNSDIDHNQLRYFNDITEKYVEDGSKIILCTAEPSWVYSGSGKGDAYRNLKFFETWFANTPPSEGSKENPISQKKRTQVLTLAGDLHHYSHYIADDQSHKITAGGGGAFMHPTQNLPDTINGVREGDLKKETTFPSSGKSKSLLFRNLWFNFTNWRFSAFLGIFYAITGWFMYLALNTISPAPGLSQIIGNLYYSPATFILLTILVLGLTLFTDTHPVTPRFPSWVYRLAGFVHGVLQGFLLLIVFWGLITFLPDPKLGLTLLGMIAGGFLISSFTFGCYLTLTNLFLNIHDNESYSALKYEGYKNFLRIHITKEKITVYPVGVEKVNKWKYKEENGKASFSSEHPIRHTLIEEPITIDLSS